MGWGTLRAAVDLGLTTSNPGIDLLFTGGEPLLRFPLIRRAVQYVGERRPPEKTVRFFLGTNGTLLDRRIIEFLARHDFTIFLSFDGIPEAQNHRSPSSFALLDGTLDSMRKERPGFFRNNVSVSAVVGPGTVEHLADSVDYFLRKGVRSFGISPLNSACSGWRSEDIQGLETQFSRIFRSCLAHFERTGQVPLASFRKDRHRSAHSSSKRPMCGIMLGNTLTIDVDGRVYGCSPLAGSYRTFQSALLRERLAGLGLGDFRDAGFRRRFAQFPAAVRRAGIFNRKEEKYSCYGRCSQCEFLDRCEICPLSIGSDPGNADPKHVSDFACAFFRTLLKYRDLFPAG